MGTATFIRRLKDWSAHANLYRLKPPLECDGEKYTFVIVSAAVVPFSGPETFIFPADGTGEPYSYGELPGSIKGAYDHEAALENAGYKVVSKSAPKKAK